MLVKHRDDDGQGLATNEVRGVRKAMKQRPADTASDFGKLIRKRANPIDSAADFLCELRCAQPGVAEGSTKACRRLAEMAEPGHKFHVPIANGGESAKRPVEVLLELVANSPELNPERPKSRLRVC